MGGVGEMALGVGPIEVPGIEGDQPSHGIKDIDERRLLDGGMAHRIGEDRSAVEPLGQEEHVGSGDGGNRRVGSSTMTDDLQVDPIRAECLQPRPSMTDGSRVVTGKDCPTDRRPWPQQDGEGVLG